MDTSTKSNQKNPAHRPPVGGFGTNTKKIGVSLPVPVCRWLETQDASGRPATAAGKILLDAHKADVRQKLKRVSGDSR